MASRTPQDLSLSKKQLHLVAQLVGLQPWHCSGGPVQLSALGISREDNKQDLFVGLLQAWQHFRNESKTREIYIGMQHKLLLHVMDINPPRDASCNAWWRD